jgi:hypothetical protein
MSLALPHSRNKKSRKQLRLGGKEEREREQKREGKKEKAGQVTR